MIGLDYLLAGYVQLASARIECRPLQAPQISITASDTSIQYDHSKSQKDLDTFEIDTKSPYPAGTRSHVGGLMSGEVSVSHNIQIMQELFKGEGKACIYLNKIKVQIHITPTIYIASDYKKDSCMYRAVMEHEKKHIKVDRYIINKYSQIIGDALKNAVNKMGGAYQGPMMAQDVEQSQKNVQLYLQAVLSESAGRMSDERSNLQQKVDSLEEYQRVQSLCEGKL